MSALGFDVAYYLSVNRDVAVAIAQGVISSALAHFERYGEREGRNPNAAFDSAYYLTQNPDVRAAVSAGIFTSAWDHYRAFGAAEGRQPSSDQLGFDSAAYLAANVDLIRAGYTTQTVLGHYVTFGLQEGRAVAPSTQGAVTSSTVYGAADDLVLPGAGLAPAVQIASGGQGRGGDTLVITAASASDLRVIDLTRADDQNRTETISGAETGPTLTGFENVDGSRALLGLSLTGAVRTDPGAAQTGSLLIGGSARDTLIGSDGADSLVGNAGNDSILGGVGNDTLSGGIGNDSLWGGSGDDLIQDAGGDDLAYGDAGNDRIDLGEGRNLAYGGDGHDTLTANLGQETLMGGAGNDRFIISAGSLSAGDVIDGEDGQDLLYLAGGSAPLVIDTGVGTLRNLEALAFVNGASDGRPNQFRVVLTDAFMAANGRDVGLILDARGLADGSKLVIDFSQLTASAASLLASGSIKLLLSPGTEVTDQRGVPISSGYTVSNANNALNQTSPFLFYTQSGIIAGEDSALNTDRTIKFPVVETPTVTPPVTTPVTPPVTPVPTFSTTLTTSLTDSLIPTALGTNEAFTGAAGTLNGTDVVNGRGGTDSLTLTGQTGTINSAGTATVTDIDRIVLQTAGATVLNGSGFTSIGEVVVSGSGNLTVQTPSADFAANTVFILGSGYANTVTDASNSLQNFGLDGAATGSAITTNRVGLAVNVASASTLGTLTTGGGTVTVTGAGTLTLGSVAGLTLLNGNAMTGALTFTVPASLSVQSGSGNDIITLGGGGARVLTGGGADVVTGGGNVTAGTTLNGGAGSDLLTMSASGGTTSLDNVSQFETIRLSNGAAYNWTITAGSAHAADTANVSLDGSALTGTSTLTFNGDLVAAHSMTITGGTGNDSVLGGMLADSVIGGDGDDTLAGGGGDDTVLGGNGNDTLYGHAGNNSVVGGAGNDYLAGGGDNDILDAGIGDDSLDGGAGNDTLLGGDGNDYMYGGTGDDQLSGGDGNDALEGVEGNDTLTAGAGDDVLRGGADDDTFVMGNNLTSSDVITGGTGNDTLTVTARNADTDLDKVKEVETITLSAGASYQYVISAGSIHAADTTTVTVNGSGLAAGESLTFDAAQVTGHLTTVYGGAGNDSLVGGSLSDGLNGGAGDDTISSGAGNDFLRGAAGADRLTGGSGIDTFYQFQSDSLARTAETITATSIGAGETITFGSGVDIITDFTTSSDKIGVTAVSAYTLLAVGSNATALAAGQHYGLRGDFAAGVFTVSNTGADTLLVVEAIAGALDAAAQTGIVILMGVTNFAVTDLIV